MAVFVLTKNRVVVIVKLPSKEVDMRLLVVDDADWLAIFGLCLRRLGHEVVCVHYSEVDQIPQLLAATRFDGAIIDWCLFTSSELNDLVASLAGIKIVWYSNLLRGAPPGHDIVIKGEVIADLSMRLLPLFILESHS